MQCSNTYFVSECQVENEELVFTLEVIVEKFGDDIAPYAVNLARNLTAAFWKYSGQADGEDEGEEDDQGGFAGHASGHKCRVVKSSYQHMAGRLESSPCSTYCAL